MVSLKNSSGIQRADLPLPSQQSRRHLRGCDKRHRRNKAQTVVKAHARLAAARILRRPLHRSRRAHERIVAERQALDDGGVYSSIAADLGQLRNVDAV